MGCCKIFTLLLSACVVMLAFFLYCPVPESIEEPGIVRLYSAGYKAALGLGNIISSCTSIPKFTAVRWFTDFGYSSHSQKYSHMEVQNLNFEGIPVRLYRPKSLGEKSPCVIYFHGGGWTIFTLDTHDSLAVEFAHGANAVVISVGYRRAPEYPYPIPFDDCLKATRHVLQNGQKYGVDPQRVAVAGDSAGGNLAAAVSLRLSEEDPSFTPPLRLQILLYPCLQMLSYNTPSYRQNHWHSLYMKDSMTMFSLSYLGIEPVSAVQAVLAADRHVSHSLRHSIFYTYISERRLPDLIKQNYVPASKELHLTYDAELAEKIEARITDPFVCPLMADDLSKVAPAYILVPEFDVMRDDGLFYMSRLKEANVSVELHYEPKQGHNFLNPPVSSGGFMVHPPPFNSSIAAWGKIYDYVKQRL